MRQQENIKVVVVCAYLPWNSPYAETEAETDCYVELQENINYCLNCPYSAAVCDNCDGKGHLTVGKGRPKKKINYARLRQLLAEQKTATDICAEFGISARTLTNYKRQIKAVIG